MTHIDHLQNQPEYQNFFKSALALKGSVTPKVLLKVGFIIVYTIIIAYLCYLYPPAALPIGPFEYGGLIMGLILVFRVNAGYDRWWEGRKLWGNIVNQCRNLTIILCNYTQQESHQWLKKVTHMTSSLPYLIKDNLRHENNLDYLSHLLDTNTMKQLSQSKNRPMILASLIAHELQQARKNHGLDSFAFIKAQEQLDDIIDSQGACERILKTPMPFVMAIKTRRFILFFLLMLPFALANISLYVCPLITGIVSYALFSIDQIGLELQNPFSKDNLSHLPLDNICNTIEENITEMRNHHFSALSQDSHTPFKDELSLI